MEATVALVTGAGRGMGRSCATALAGAADVLVLADLDEAGLAVAAGELAGSCGTVVPVVLDVSDAAALAALAEQIGGLGRLGPIAHAAGISPTMADWRRVLGVDLVGSALLVEALTPLVTDGTAMVLFASMAAHLMAQGIAPEVDLALDEPRHPDHLERVLAAFGPTIEDTGMAYSLAKRGVQRLARATAIAWGPRGGRICSVSPGMIDTPQGRQEAAAQPGMTMLLEHSPIHRFGTAEELAAVVAFLTSPAASFLTGTDVLVDGGVVAAIEALTAQAG
ncbi:MAG: SDR family oxidoreductase [Actinomycetes bacterium]